MSHELPQEILRLSITVLRERVQQELQENPVLDLEEWAEDERVAEGGTPILSAAECADETDSRSQPAILPFSKNPIGFDDLVDDDTVISHVSTASISHAEPDIAVARTASRNYQVRPLHNGVPSLSVSRRFVELCHQPDVDPEAKAYLQRKIQAAERLLESIEQRRTFLEKVTRAIVQHQQPYLDSGKKPIEPLGMQQIAAETGLSVKTVEQIVDNKWVRTPHGVFPLKRFFAPSP